MNSRSLTMDTISFGRNGLKVSKLRLGTMTLRSSKWKPWVRMETGAVNWPTDWWPEGKQPGNEPMPVLHVWLYP